MPHKPWAPAASSFDTRPHFLAPWSPGAPDYLQNGTNLLSEYGRSLFPWSLGRVAPAPGGRRWSYLGQKRSSRKTPTCRPRSSSQPQHPLPSATIITYPDLSNNPYLVCLIEASKPLHHASPRHCSSAKWTTGSHPTIPAPLQTSAGQLGHLIHGTAQMLYGASDSASWQRFRSTSL